MIQCVAIFFFFQAEDGIRDKLVTGVQTCALPISPCPPARRRRRGVRRRPESNRPCPERGWCGRGASKDLDDSRKRRQARAELGENQLLLLEAASLTRHDLGGGVLDELGTTELAFEKRDLLARPFYFLAEAGALGREVHHAFQVHVDVDARRDDM